jgi:hypothetical protein
MKRFFLPLLALLAMNTTSQAELLDNGDFSDGIKHWYLNRSPHYGVETSAKVKDGALHLSDLTGPNPVYLNLVQPVDIQEGTTYSITFEVMAPPGTVFSFAIGDHQVPLVTGRRMTVEGNDWESASYELTAKISTDSNWYKKEKKNASKSKLKDGRTLRDKKSDDKKYPGRCLLAFGLGGVEDRIALRNISLVEVASEPSSE